MLNVASTEILVVLLVCIIFLEKKDWLKIIIFFRQLHSIFLQSKRKISQYISELSGEIEEVEEIEERNIKYIKGEDQKMHRSYIDHDESS